MIIKTIKYTDYNDVEREEQFCFHLNKAEVVEWLTTSGNYTLDKVMERLVRAEKVKDVMMIYKDLILRSYGERSLDGISFVKTKEATTRFEQSEAYSVLFMELIGDEKKAADFFTGIMPKDMAAEINKVMSNPNELPDELKAYGQAIRDMNATDNVVAIETGK